MDWEDRLVKWLREARRVMALCGAGVSAESGLPTFHGHGEYWEGRRVEEVTTPEAFRRDPQMGWRYYAARQEGLMRAEPNRAHTILAAMEERYEDFMLVSQNVDNLHERAGSRKLLKLHGNLMETRCPTCGRVEALAQPVPAVEVERGELPHCPCGSLLHPNVIWFDEHLDPAHLRHIETFLTASRDSLLVLILGTSGVVSAAYGIPYAARLVGGRIAEINPRGCALANETDLVLRAPAGKLLARLWPRVAE